MKHHYFSFHRFSSLPLFPIPQIFHRFNKYFTVSVLQPSSPAATTAPAWGLGGSLHRGRRSFYLNVFVVAIVSQFKALAGPDSPPGPAHYGLQEVLPSEDGDAGSMSLDVAATTAQ